MRKLPVPMDAEDELYDLSYTITNAPVIPLKWLFPGFVPAGKVSILVGEPGLGKSQVVTDLAARVTRGLPMPFCNKPAEPATVLMLNMEDHLYDTVRPRLLAAGADLDRVRVFAGTGMGLIADAERLVTIADKHEAALIVFDPLAAFLEDFDIGKDRHVRMLLQPLTRIGTLSGAAILIVHHVNKNERARALSRAAGSHALTAVARSVMTVVRDPENPDGRVLTLLKGNLSAPPPSCCFHFEQDAPTGSTRIVWDREAPELNVDSLLTQRSADKAPERLTVFDQAERFLRCALEGGPMPSKELEELALAQGFSRATFQRAKVAITVSTRCGGIAGDGKWMTELR